MISRETANVVSLSGGKDSTAMALLAIEREAENIIFVFADTGHEHPMTYEYIEYLRTVLPSEIHVVRGNFDERIANKRLVVEDKWRREEVSEDKIQRALEVLQPTGNPFLDLCLWKGRFPSTRRRFCSEQLKHEPIDAFMDQLIESGSYGAIVSWQGVRRDESHQRANLVEREDHPDKFAFEWYRPILDWKAEDCFAMHEKHGVEPNPLYKLGMGRVGCMPCIHATKGELFEISRRFPEEIKRVAEWERLVSAGAKRDVSTFMDVRVTAKYLGTGIRPEDVDASTHGIETYAEYAGTAHGGKQWDLIATTEEPPMCQSIYGLCE